MRVLALTRYDELGASSRVRTLQYLPLLLREGIKVAVRPLLDDSYLEKKYAHRRIGKGFLCWRYAGRLAVTLSARQYDLVLIEKELMPWAPGLFERGLLAGVPYVLDYDDAVFHTYDHHPSPLLRRVMGRKIDRVMRGAALVIAGNAYLAARARAAGAPRVEILPSVIDLNRYGPVSPPPAGPFTIGWIGSPGSEHLLDSVRDVLAEVTVARDVRLVLVGASNRALDGVPHECRKWSEASEVDEMRRFHVGIMPLRDTPWERGKCGYKLIQCMGAGRPVVASPVGVNAEIVEEGASGYLARTPEEWGQAFERLRRDPAHAAALGLRGRRIVEERYALDRAAPRLAALLRSAAGAGRLRGRTA